MIQNSAEISQLINQLAMNIISVETEDVMALGNILKQIEEIENITETLELKEIHVFCPPLKKLIEKMIFNECPSTQESLDLISSGVRIIQTKISYGDLNQSLPEEVPFWEQMESLIGPLKPVLAASQETEATQEQSQTDGTLELSQDMELFNDFVSEAMEHLETIEINLINLEQAPEDKECINAIFRPFHTIKGVSGFLNLQDIHKFSHAIESLLDDARNEKIMVNQKIIDTILESVDFLKTMILDQKAVLVSAKPQLNQVDLGPWLDRIDLLRESLPPAGSLDETPEIKVPPLGEILASKGVVSGEEVGEALKAQIEEKHDQKIGEILITDQKAKPKEVLDGLRDQKRLSGQGIQAVVKVDTKKLDNLVDMVGELVIAQSLVQQNPNLASINDQKLGRDFSQLRRITMDLQKIAMSLRMVPIRHTFQKMIRLVRDLSKKSGKPVELKLFGEETEIDRNMVDTLYDPLVHMIRNSIDHGIESPQQRKAEGKGEIGEISLRAYQKGGNIVIEIEDDGQGLNRSKIMTKAKERRIISEENSLTDFQIDNLIFEAGFSTAEKVTDVSGRGVGMDVVKRVIEKIRGKIEIYSAEGKGCRFLIRVPLTLAIMDGILVQIGKERFIIPTVTIKETLRPVPEDVFTVGQKEEMVKVRDSLLPLVRLNNLLNITSNDKKPWEGLVVVVENDGIQKGLMVDDLLGKQEVVIKNLGEKLKTVQGVAGGAILGDGQISLILDINGIFEIYRGKTTIKELSQWDKVCLVTEEIRAESFENELDYRFFKELMLPKEEFDRVMKQEADPLPIPVIQAMNNHNYLPNLPQLRGSKNIGYTFFEDNIIPKQNIENAARYYDRVVAGSSWCEEMLRFYGLSRVTTIIQGIDPMIFNPEHKEKEYFKDRFVLFSGGKFELRKGHDIVIKAYKVLQDRYPDVLLITCWFNHWLPSINTMAASPYLNFQTTTDNFFDLINRVLLDNGIDLSRVINLPVYPNQIMPSIYKNTDLGFFPNRCEGGTNLVLMEYMACGKPVLGSFSSGHKDILTDRNSIKINKMGVLNVAVNGTNTAVWDEPFLDETIEKLDWAYQHRDEIGALGRQAGEDLAAKTWEQTGKQFYDLVKGS